MRRILRWVVVGTGAALLAVVALGFATYLAFAFVPAIGTPSEAALHESVADEADGLVNKCCMPDMCSTVTRRTWDCSVSFSAGSGGVDYRVRSRGTRCWDARLLAKLVYGERSPPERMSGCVKLGDQFWASELASDLVRP